MYTQKTANIFDHIQDHSRLGLENKFLENKSGRIFLPSTGLLYKFLPINLGVCKSTFYNFYYITSEVKQYYLSYRPWTECGISQFFPDKLHSVNIQDDQSWAFRETVQKISKITCTDSWFSLLTNLWCELSVWSSVWMYFNRVTLKHNNEFFLLFNGFSLYNDV